MNKSIWIKTLGVFLCFNMIFVFLGLRLRENPGDKYDQTFHALAKMLEAQHFSPKPMDDQTSERVYNDYLNTMDVEKNIFIKSDITGFDKYKDKIDDELTLESVDLYHLVIDKYKVRIAELQKE